MHPGALVAHHLALFLDIEPVECAVRLVSIADPSEPPRRAFLDLRCLAHADSPAADAGCFTPLWAACRAQAEPGVGLRDDSSVILDAGVQRHLPDAVYIETLVVPIPLILWVWQERKVVRPIAGPEAAATY
jgi:hypothetical protein